MTDKHLKPGFGGVPSGDENEFSRAAWVTTDAGTVMKVYPLMRVSLGQAVVVVADGKVYCLEAVWNDVGDEDRVRFMRAAARGADWIDRNPNAVAIRIVLMRGGRWCMHKGFSSEARRAIRDP